MKTNANTNPNIKKHGTRPPKGPAKQFQKDGHWIVNPNKTEVFVCTCGNKYLRTRAAQTKCVRCMFAK